MTAAAVAGGSRSVRDGGVSCPAATRAAGMADSGCTERRRVA